MEIKFIIYEKKDNVIIFASDEIPPNGYIYKTLIESNKDKTDGIKWSKLEYETFNQGIDIDFEPFKYIYNDKNKEIILNPNFIDKDIR